MPLTGDVKGTGNKRSLSARGIRQSLRRTRALGGPPVTYATRTAIAIKGSIPANVPTGYCRKASRGGHLYHSALGVTNASC